MKVAFTFVLTACVLFFSPAVQADWDLTDPAKWVQLPDETPEGVDVKLFNTQEVPPALWLADDFLCTETEPITDVHIWGSWFLDQVADPSLIAFNISFWSDIPTNEVVSYSRPGVMLWETNVFYPEFMVRHWTNVVPGEGWYDPFEEVYTPFADTNIWQYNFFFDPTNTFIQQGTVAEPRVYWLAIRAVILEGTHAFGWKTSFEHWNDDAVYAEIPPVGSPSWEELIYPPDHPLDGQSMDLAFVITTQPPEPEFDFGDAPTNYPTLLIDTGANHMIVGGGPWFGDPTGGVDPDVPDAEADGQPHATASGDDLAGVSPDDEDGIIFASPLIPGQAARIDVKTPIGGQVDAWIDYNGDGDWSDSGEKIYTGVMPPGTNSIFPVIPSPVASASFARFRIGSTNYGVIPVDGGWPDGEVEDYRIQFEDSAYDFGDAPIPGFPTTLALTGAYHVVVPGIFLGTYIDAELDGQPNGTSTGDDIAPAWLPDDEDGIILPPALIPGASHIFVAFASAPGDLTAWIDFSADGDWGDSGEFIGAFPLAPGPNVLPLFVPPGAIPGGVHARFRYSSLSGPAMFEYGGWPDGEVEDYEVLITDADFGDAPDSPYPTTLGSGGAWHAVPSSPIVYLGASVDIETDGQPTALADGDDTAGDDEDGVTVISSLIRSDTATVAIVSSTNASLEAWVDLNQNGSWVDIGDNVLSVSLTSGVNFFDFPVPFDAAVGPTYARFRVTSSGLLSPAGFAPDGEVEDYVFEILQPSISSTNLVITNIMVNAGATGTVYWTAQPNVTYQLQAVTNTFAPYWHTWTNVGGLVTAPTNVQIDSDVSATNKIYRVVVPWVP